MRRVLWLLLLLAPLIAHTETLEDVALDAFRDIQDMPHHRSWEYGGIIIERNGTVLHTAIPRTIEQADSLVMDIEKMKGTDRLLGIYHTHPCLPAYWTGLFSVPDIVQDAFWRVPSFILDQCTDKIHEFQWGVDNIWATGRTVDQNGKKVHLPAGRIVAQL